MILCDLMMPAITGMELYAALANALPDVSQRMVFITGGAFTEQAAKFIDSIDNPKLGKPFDAGEVRALVKSLTREPVVERE